MNTVGKEIQKAIVLWLSGARLEDIRTLPEMEALLQQGASVELDPSPIAERQNQYYQAASGRSPASFGFFDSLIPRNYTIQEESLGRGTTPKLLPDMLRTAGWTVQYDERQLSELAPCIQRWTSTTPGMPSCLIIKCEVRTIGSEAASSIAEALRIAKEAVGETGLLALFSDTQPARVKRFVNVNNFLAEMGVIEQDEQSGKVNWSNSLAYFTGHGQLWVNLQGREVQGAVHPQDEYEEVRNTLVKALPTKLRDIETAASVIEQVYRKEDLYSSEYLFCAPDLVIVFKPGYAPSARSTRLEFDNATFTTSGVDETVFAGAHPSLLRGFLVAVAPSLAAGATASESAPLTSIVPTLLHALGIEYVDSNSPVIGTMFVPSYLETHPIRTGAQSQELSEEDEELIINRLRDLGYV